MWRGVSCLLGAVGHADLEYALQARRHHRLLVELWRLCQVHGAVEVLYREQPGATLRAAADQLGGLDLGEPFAAQVLGEQAHDLGLQAEDRQRLGVAQAHHAMLQHRLQAELSGILVHRQRQLRRRTRNHRQRLGLHLVASGRLAVGGHCAAHLDHGLERERIALRVGRSAAKHHLAQARAVAQQQEADPAQIPLAVRPAAQQHGAAGVAGQLAGQDPVGLPRRRSAARRTHSCASAACRSYSVAMSPCTWSGWARPAGEAHHLADQESPPACGRRPRSALRRADSRPAPAPEPAAARRRR